MECSCIVVDDFDCPAEFFTEKDVTARKVHKCSECGRDIQPGEIYKRETGKWDGWFNTYKTCQDCLSIRYSFFCNVFLFQGVREMTEEFIRDCFGDVPEKLIAPLTPKAREWVCNEIESCWEDYHDE